MTGLLFTNRHIYLEKVLNSFFTSKNLWALLIAASILALFLMIPLSFRSLVKSFFKNLATLIGSKFAKAFSKFLRLCKTVRQLSPAWKLSKTKNSNIFLSSRKGTPHSLSWYSRINLSDSPTHAHLLISFIHCGYGTRIR